MTRVVLPTSPSPMRVTGPHLMDFGGTIGGGLGGALQRVNRLGARWWYAAEWAPMESAAARIWSADLNRGLREGVSLRIHQPGLSIGVPGNPLVNGAGQTGNVLIADGFTPGYTAQKGQFLALVNAAGRHLHQVGTAGTANAAGQLSLDIEPRMRLSPADNTVIELVGVRIDGLLEGVPEHGFEPDQLARGFNLRIVEAR